MINVPYELFGKLNPNKLKPFIEADKIKTKNDIYMLNVSAWYQGIYVGKAINASFSEKAEYPDKPIDFSADTSEPDIELQSLKFSAWADVFNEGFIQRQEKNIDNSEGP